MDRIRIFDGIQRGDINRLLNCFSAEIRQFRQGETILDYSDGLKHICVLIVGNAEIMWVDAEGNSSTLESIGRNAVFGELFSLPLGSDSYFAVAKTVCEVLFVRYERLTRQCEKACEFHQKLINNLFVLSAQKAQSLSRRICILSQKGLRQKLLLYLEYISQEKKSKKFEIPMTLSGLADYLSVDRSAMMRELSRLRSEEIIHSSGRYFEMLNPPEEMRVI